MKKNLYNLRAILLLCSFLISWPDSYGQVIAFSKNIEKSSNSQSKSLKEILNTLRNHYKVDILFSDKMVESISVSEEVINFNNKLENNLENVLRSTGLKFKKNAGSTYLIIKSKKETENKEVSGLSNKSSFSSEILNKVLAVITGTVTGENGEGLPGVNVVVKGTTMGTVTDAAGRYSITVPDEGAILVFSFVGYGTEEIPVNSNTVININLLPDLQSLGEVVVIGYGTVKKRDLTGSVASIKSNEIVQTPTHNAVETMQGRIAGVDITRESGVPGAQSNITVRGNKSITSRDKLAERNSPLYVIDGVQIPQGGNISDLNPNDIESIEVLKDASATSIYGAMGANGVIIVTTKKGAEGKIRVNYSGYYGVNEYTYPKSRVGEDYMNLRREAWRTTGEWSGTADDQSLFPDAGEWDAVQAGQWVDWVDLLQKNGTQQNHSISVASGTGKTKVFASGGYFKEEGMFKNADFTRYNARFNVDQTISKWAKAGILSQITYSSQNERKDPLSQASSISPLGVPYNEAGMVNLYPVASDKTKLSPLADERTGDMAKNNLLRTNVLANGYVEINPLKGLTFRSSFGANITFSKRGIFYDKESLARQGPKTSLSSNETIFSRFLNWDNVLTYARDFKDHTFSISAITSYLQSDKDNTYAEGTRQLLSSQLYYDLSGTSADGRILRSPYEGWKNMAYAGRINYSYRGKYLLTLTGRYDGASRLAEGNKWYFFPSIAAGWNLSEEGFLKTIGFLNNLKLRGSYGVSGNYAIDVYGTQSGLKAMPNMGFGDVPAPMVQFKTTIGNPDLAWEKSATTDVGVDLGLFSNRITATLDLYRTNTSDILMLRSLPQSSGVANVYQNVAETKNEGVELAMTTQNIDKGGFKWSSTVTFTRNQEKITKLTDGKDIITNERESLLLDHPINSFYTFKKLGIWQENEADEAALYRAGSATGTPFQPGDIKVADLNGDHIIDATNDRTFIGSAVPMWVGGLQNNFSYKGFDLNVFLFMRYGQTIDAQFLGRYNPDGTGNGVASLNYWTPENPTNDYPRPRKGTSLTTYTGYTGYQALNFVNGTYFKIKNVTFGYTVPSKISKKFFFDNVRLYVTGSNLFIKAKSDLLKNYDPERGGAEASPLSRTYVFGINLGL
jgi:TonB-linked SusC/RagA family outer membrane protein